MSVKINNNSEPIGLIDLRGAHHRKLGSNSQELREYKLVIPQGTIPQLYEKRDDILLRQMFEKLDERARIEFKCLKFDPAALDNAYRLLLSYGKDFESSRSWFFEHCQSGNITVKFIDRKPFLVINNFNMRIVLDQKGEHSHLPNELDISWVNEINGERKYCLGAFVNQNEDAAWNADPATIKELNENARRHIKGFSPHAFLEAYRISNCICKNSSISVDPRSFFKLCQEGRITVKEVGSESWIIIDTEHCSYIIDPKGKLKKKEKQSVVCMTTAIDPKGKSVQNEKRSAVCITAAKDDLNAFGYRFEDRKKVLEQTGLNVDFVQQKMATVFEAEAYVSARYPAGCNYLLLRMHGTPTSGILSDQKGGQFNVHPTKAEEQAIHRICQTVLPGGTIVIESCQAGHGDHNLLEFLAEHCRPGVVVIGSKANIGGKVVQISSLHPRDIRFYSQENGKEVDATRIYYQSERGPVDIPVAKLDALLALVGREELDLCCQFLGERDNPQRFATLRQQVRKKAPVTQDVQSFKEKLRSLPISLGDVDTEWQELLTEFAKAANVSNPQSLTISPAVKKGDVELGNGGAILNLRQFDADLGRQTATVLLGMASLDQFLVSLSLVDLEEHATGAGTAAQCIHALSGLALHANPNLPLTKTLESYLTIMKESYRVAKETGRTEEWAKKLLSVNYPCIDAFVEAMNEFLLSGSLGKTKQEQIQEFIQNEDLPGLKQYLGSTQLSMEERGVAIIAAVAVDWYDGICQLASRGSMLDSQWDQAIGLAKQMDDFLILHTLKDYRKMWEETRQRALNNPVLRERYAGIC